MTPSFSGLFEDRALSCWRLLGASSHFSSFALEAANAFLLPLISHLVVEWGGKGFLLVIKSFQLNCKKYRVGKEKKKDKGCLVERETGNHGGFRIVDADNKERAGSSSLVKSVGDRDAVELQQKNKKKKNDADDKKQRLQAPGTRISTLANTTHVDCTIGLKLDRKDLTDGWMNEWMDIPGSARSDGGGGYT